MGSIGTVLGALIGAILGIAIIGIVLSTLFMMVGAKMAQIPGVTFGKSMLAAIGSALVTWVVTLVLSILPLIGTVLGFFIGLFFSLLIIKGVFSTTMGKAFLAWVFNLLATIVATLIGILTFGGALLALFKS